MILQELENQSLHLLREAYAQQRHCALLWSMGKDSTVMLWIARKAFFGTIPFPVVHIDTSYKFQEIYEFRDKYAQEWNLNMVIAQNKTALQEGMNNSKGVEQCCQALKTDPLKHVVAENDYKALFLAIRRDEHGVRAKERYFSHRATDFKWEYKHQRPELWNIYNSHMDSGEHIRVHPMLHWTEKDIWEYIQQEKIPTNELYFSKKGKRYRSIGCETCCHAVNSSATNVKKIIKELETTEVSERAGRAQDKEADNMIQKLRSLGYM